MKIYLACPYSHEYLTVKIGRFWKANEKAAELMKQGHIVFSPISHSHPIALQCDLPGDYHYWKAWNRSFIEWCDQVWILRLEGWKESIGVKGEIEDAAELGKPSFYI